MSADVLDIPEQIDPEELRDAARRLLGDKVDRRAGWDKARAGDGADLESEMAELGWLMLTAPEARGGLGQSFEALAPLYEEMGRALSPVTIAPAMAAVDVLAEDDSEVGGGLLDRILSGEARVAVAFTDDTGPAAAKLALVQSGAGVTDLLLLPDRGVGKAVLIDARGAGVEIRPVDTWDRTRSYADITLSSPQSAELHIDGAAASQLARAHLDLAIAWDGIGGAQQMLDEAVAYMGTRQQFGRPIGSFQALKHRAADLKVGLEIARALAAHASRIYAFRGEAWSDLAGQARLLAVDAYRAIAEESVQFHGGIGFTWEHDCHLFLKRALMNEILGATPEQVRDRVAPGVLTRALQR